MIPDPSPPFELGMSDQLREKIRALGIRAGKLGFGHAFRDSVQSIFEALRLSPRAAGDPLRHRRQLKLVEYRIIRDKLIVHYTVHERIPMVTVWRFVPVLGNPLASPPNNGQ